MVLVIQEWRRPFEPDSCKFPIPWEGSGGCEARCLLSGPSIEQWAETLKICRAVEKEWRRNPQETGLRGLRIFPLWTQRKLIWMRYGQQQRFVEHELRQCSKVNTWALTPERYTDMNSWIKLQTIDSYITRTIKVAAWKMITHKKEINVNRRKHIHTTHCSIWNPSISSIFILILNSSPKYVSRGTGITIIHNYSKILQNS